LEYQNNTRANSTLAEIQSIRILVSIKYFRLADIIEMKDLVPSTTSPVILLTLLPYLQQLNYASVQTWLKSPIVTSNFDAYALLKLPYKILIFSNSWHSN